MKSSITIFLIVLLMLAAQSLNAQESSTSRGFSIETEPMAFILGGVGATGSYQYDSWTFSIEAFGELTVPESLHGNDGFSSSLKGVELQVERFLTGTDGFYLGPEVGLSSLTVTHKATNSSERKTGFSVGLRGGYHWDTGLGDLYVTPVGGLSYSLNAEDMQIQGETFESGSVTPWATIGIGWRF